MLFALLCKDKPDHLNVRMETRPAHVEYLNKLNAEGALKMAGPFLDGEGKPCGTLAIMHADTIEAAKALADGDPYAKAGLFESVDIKPFNWVFNNPEA
ncbi:YciI-like protein [Rhizobium mesoamericanum]|uniref:Protein yciI n=1 Tax=Rhizobium mesoamericanum STM3625 TaxID=1211777 RepID=K0Q452_9HYPH|nr:YciI-like protein [Rhizobium mesoamericanum]CCM77609.1 Protein yciI [Rhizobium mesoamericanum STM3625]